MKRDLKIERTYDKAPELVWRALTDPAAISEWLMETRDFQPRIGQKFQFRAQPQPGWNGIVDCQVLEVDAPRRLAYSWKSNGHSTRVIWTLEPQGGGTRLLLEHTGFAGMRGVLLSFILSAGWKKMLRGKFADALSRVNARGFHPSPTRTLPACH